MRKRRGFFLAASVLAAAIALASACSFPEPGLVDAPTLAESGTLPDAEPDAEGLDGGAEAALLDSIFSIDGNQNVDPDGASQEASLAPEAGPPIDASGCPDKCDCDEDGFRSKNVACADAGRDCNDLDPFIPHDGFVSSKPVGHSGDWDCNGTVTTQFPVNVSCAILTDCSAQGFKDAPGCGDTGNYVFCTKFLLTGLCVEDTAKAEARVQGCR